MSDTTKTEVRVIEGWARPGGFSPTGVKCLYDTNFKGEQVECSMVIGDKAVPMSTVVELYKDAKMIARTVAALQMSKEERIAIVDHDFAEIAAKYGIKLP